MHHEPTIIRDTISYGTGPERARPQANVFRLSCSCGHVGPPRVERNDAGLDWAAHAATVEVIDGETVAESPLWPENDERP